MDDSDLPIDKFLFVPQHERNGNPMTFNPARRFMALPAYLWLLFPPLLVAVAFVSGRPGGISEPGERTAIFQSVVLVTRDGDSLRFVPFGADQQVTPLWAVDCMITSQQEARRSLGWANGSPTLGFWWRSGRWRYSLDAMRFVADWNPEVDPVQLPQEDLKRLRPMLVEELNRRNPNEHWGDRLTSLLDLGLQRTSYLCIQNAVILLAWLSLPLAVLSMVMMFIRPR